MIGREYMIPMNLQFFAKEGPGGEKTEEATSKKLDDARKDGQVGKSTELVTAVMLTALFLTLKIYIGFLGSKLVGCFMEIYGNIHTLSAEPMSIALSVKLLNMVLLDIIIIAGPMILVAFVVAFIVNTVQFKWKVSGKPLKPKFNKMNPISGFKKLFSKDKLMELLKSVVKIVIICMVVYNAVKDKWAMLVNFYDIPLYQAISFIGSTVIDLGLKISALFLVIGFADLFYQKKKFKKDMRMTKQEVKDEWKNSEGDPQIKSQIKARMRAASQRRMMQELPKADVVITNPTHLAVALKYEKEESEAPRVIAKGADYLASKIKEIAKDNDIEIVENKPLARMLYHNVDVGEEIPPELYQTVAEVLAYVYGLKNKLQ